MAKVTNAQLKWLDWAIQQAADWEGGIPDPEDRADHRERVAEARKALSNIREERKRNWEAMKLVGLSDAVEQPARTAARKALQS